MAILLILTSVLCVLGIYFRISEVGLKEYWFDEVLSLLRINGYFESDIESQLEVWVSGREVRLADLKQFWRLNANSTLVDIVRSSLNHPHLPLYYSGARVWSYAFPSDHAIRWFSVITSILTLPALFWLLCDEWRCG